MNILSLNSQFEFSNETVAVMFYPFNPLNKRPRRSETGDPVYMAPERLSELVEMAYMSPAVDYFGAQQHN